MRLQQWLAGAGIMLTVLFASPPPVSATADCCIPIALLAIPEGVLEYSSFRCCCNREDPDDCIEMQADVSVQHPGGMFVIYTCGYDEDCTSPLYPPPIPCMTVGPGLVFNHDWPPKIFGQAICDAGCYNLGCIPRLPELFYPRFCDCEAEASGC